LGGFFTERENAVRRNRAAASLLIARKPVPPEGWLRARDGGECTCGGWDQESLHDHEKSRAEEKIKETLREIMMRI
jgi:hypothetical protein